MSLVSVIGAGAWGTALAKVLAERGHEVRLWSWQPEHAASMQQHRENLEFLPGVRLPDAIDVTSLLEWALAGVEFAVLALPSHAFRSTLSACRGLLEPQTAWVSATKGIENGSLMLMAEVLADVFGPTIRRRSAVLSGPSFASEVARELPTNIVVASENRELAESVQQLLATDWLRVYANHDPTGVEIGGAVKNVIAIAAGACDGLGFGSNTRAALITRGLAEMTRLAVAKGGEERTLAGLSGLGDLVLTCTGELSRNRTVGFEMGRGRQLEDVLSHLGHVAEGVLTARSTYELAGQLGVEMPICNEVYRVLFEKKAVQQAVRDVLTRPLKTEWA